MDQRRFFEGDLFGSAIEQHVGGPPCLVVTRRQFVRPVGDVRPSRRIDELLRSHTQRVAVDMRAAAEAERHKDCFERLERVILDYFLAQNSLGLGWVENRLVARKLQGRTDWC
jgi:hypothetical protein